MHFGQHANEERGALAPTRPPPLATLLGTSPLLVSNETNFFINLLIR